MAVTCHALPPRTLSPTPVTCGLASEATLERADVLRNYAAFEAMRAKLEASHLGQFAVLHDG